MATDPGGYTPPAGGTSSNIELYDANNERVGSYNKQGDGGYNLNLTVKTNADVDLNGDDTVDFGDNAASDKEYFVEIMKNAYMMMEGTTSTLQENETVNYYKVATVNGEEQADMSASGKLGSEQTFDGVTSIYDGNGASLGQKSVLTLLMHLRRQQLAFVRLRMRSCGTSCLIQGSVWQDLCS